MQYSCLWVPLHAFDSALASDFVYSYDEWSEISLTEMPKYVKNNLKNLPIEI